MKDSSKLIVGHSKEKQDLRDRLRMAVLSADRQTVSEILQDEKFSEKELDRLDQNGRTAILNAAFAYHLDICLDFLDAGANVCILEKETGSSLLHYLCKAKEPVFEESLLTLKTILHGVLAKGCNPNLQDREGCTALHYASRLANKAVVTILLQHGALVNHKNSKQETALHWAVQNRWDGWEVVTKTLLDGGADPNAAEENGRSPLGIVLQLQQTTPSSKEVNDLVVQMQRMQDHDIQSVEEGSVIRVAVAGSDINVQKRVRKVVAVGGGSVASPSSSTSSGGPGGSDRQANGINALSSSSSSIPNGKARIGSRDATPLDLTIVGECTSDNITIEYGAPGLPLQDLVVTGLYRMYQDLFFGNTHFLFVGRVANVGSKIVAVLRWPDKTRRAYHALVVNHYGMWETWIDQRPIVGEDNLDEASPRDLEVKLLNYFRDHWSTASVDMKLLDSRVVNNAPLFASLMQHQDQQQQADASWTSVSTTKSDLPCLLLGLECRLGLGKRLTIGVIYMKSGQSEEEAFQNKSSKSFDTLLNILGYRVPLKDWRSYNGGLSGSHIHYSSWRGFEIVFHVATELNKEAQRQYIGNDKCTIVCVDYGCAVQPQFRGNVNSVCIVAQALTQDEANRYERQHQALWGQSGFAESQTPASSDFYWRTSVFHRRRVANFKPVVTTTLLKDPFALRDVLLCNAINGISATSNSPPYSNTLDQMFTEETERLADRFLEPASKKKSANQK